MSENRFSWSGEPLRDRQGDRALALKKCELRWS